MSLIITKDFVQTTLSAPAGSTDVSMSVNTATTPFLNIPSPSGSQLGYLVLCDDLNNPTKFEVISFTGYSSGTISGIVRGLGGTTATTWLAGHFVYMAPLSLSTTPPVWALNLSTGDINYMAGKVGIGTTTPAKPLDVVGNAGFSADVATATLHVSGVSTVAHVDATTINTSGDITSTGNLVGAHLAIPGSQSLGSYKLGTFTPTLIGGSSAGTAVYTLQTGNYVIIGRMCILQFSIAVNWPSVPPSGQLIISGYPSGIGSVAGFSGSFSNLLGFLPFKGFTNNTIHSPTIIQNMVNIVPLTIANAGNNGIVISRNLSSNDQSLGTPDTAQHDIFDATYIASTTTGVTLTGTLSFLTDAEA